MYTSYGEPSVSQSAAGPSGTGSAASNTPLKTNLNVDAISSLPQRMGPPPTSSPAIQPTHPSPSVGGGHPGPQPTNSWPIDGRKDAHLSGSEPRMSPGMISRRQRANSLRQSSMHESDERTTTKKTVSMAVDEGEEESSEEKE